MPPQAQAGRVAMVLFIVEGIVFAAVWTFVLFAGRRSLPEHERPGGATYWAVGLFLVALVLLSPRRTWLYFADGFEEEGAFAPQPRGPLTRPHVGHVGLAQSANPRVPLGSWFTAGRVPKT